MLAFSRGVRAAVELHTIDLASREVRQLTTTSPAVRAVPVLVHRAADRRRVASFEPDGDVKRLAVSSAWVAAVVHVPGRTSHRIDVYSFDLSIEGRRVVWAENFRGRGIVRALNVS